LGQEAVKPVKGEPADSMVDILSTKVRTVGRQRFTEEYENIGETEEVKGFHQLVMYGNYAKELNAFCQLFGIEAITI